jgi:hypothetical protein
MSEEPFGCTLSSGQRISTILVVLLVLFVCLALVFAMVLAIVLGKSTEEKIVFVLVSTEMATLVLILSVFIVTARFAPRGYLVGPSGITIVRRNGRKIFLPAQEIMSVEAVEREILKGRINTFAAGGYFGSWGSFYCPKLQRFRGYWTNADSLVLVRTLHEGPFVVSPDSRERFVEYASRSLRMPSAPRC